MNYVESLLTAKLVADVVLFSGEYILLIKRKYDPFKGKYALPGGHIDEDEEPLDAAIRELEEETGISGLRRLRYFKIGVFDKAYRDPRNKHTISYAYGYIGPDSEHFRNQAVAQDDAEKVLWAHIESAFGYVVSL